MISKFISGEHNLDDLQKAIAFEEFAFRQAVGSKIDSANGEQGNLVQFKDVNVFPGDLALRIASANPPTGYSAEWTASMLVEGSPRLITAWRQATKNIAPPAQPAAAQPLAAAPRAANFSEAASIPQLQPHAEPSPFAVHDGKLLGPDGEPVKTLSSPNQSARNDRRYLVIHYTAGTTLNGAVSWFMNPAAKASAHLIIARDGSVVQMVPFSRRAWHAGVSAWEDLTALNGHSIGIELVNAGKLRRSVDGWVNWAGRVIADAEVAQATHRLESVEAGWQSYTEAQIQTLLDVAVALHARYQFADVLGHDDIAPERKLDPGPLFPMQSVRARLLGRA